MLTWIPVVLPVDCMLQAVMISVAMTVFTPWLRYFFLTLTLSKNVSGEGQSLHTCHFSDFKPQKQLETEHRIHA